MSYAPKHSNLVDYVVPVSGSLELVGQQVV